jgi:hypothetical protein
LGLSRLLGPERDKIIEGWRIFHNEEPKVITTIKPLKMRGTRHATRMGEKRNAGCGLN